MFEKNIGQTDRTIRAVAGIAAIAAFFAVTGTWAWVLLVVGIVLLGTAALGTCPPYTLLGINTRGRRG